MHVFCDSYLQLIVSEHSRYQSSSEFWDHLSEEGRVVSWTELMARLRCDRKRRDNEYARAAKEKYGDLSMIPAFTYIKSGVKKTMASPQSIAKVFRELEGLKDVSTAGNLANLFSAKYLQMFSLD